MCVFLDNSLITSRSQQVSGGSEATGRGLNMHLKQKCTFLMPEVEYLGHKICQEGMPPTESKVQAVSDAPEPESRIEILPGVCELLWEVFVQPSHHCSTP